MDDHEFAHLLALLERLEQKFGCVVPPREDQAARTDDDDHANGTP
jgi:hypothetical protein